MLEREFVPPPCRVIFTAGRFTEEATDEHKLIQLVRDAGSSPPQSEKPPTMPRSVPLKDIVRVERPPRDLPIPERHSSVDIGEIKALLAQGKTRREVAGKLACSKATVDRHMRKSGVVSPTKNAEQRRKFWTARSVDIADVRRLLAEGKSVKDIAHELAFTTGAVYKRMRIEGEMPDRDKMAAIAPGCVFGWLTIIRESRRGGKEGRIFACLCKCGAVTEAPYKALNRGTRTSCGCKRPQKLADNPERIALACELYRTVGTSEAARRLGCSRTGVRRLLAAGGVTPKARNLT